MASSAARRLVELSDRLGEFDQVVVRTAGEAVSEAVRARVAADTGGDRALSGIKGGRFKLDVTSVPLSNPAGVRIWPQRGQLGMWSMVSSGTAAHEVGARRRRKQVSKLKRTASRARAVNIGGGPGGWRTGPFRVRGTRGKDTWRVGRDQGYDAAIPAVLAKFHEVVND